MSERDAHQRMRGHARKLNLKLFAVAEAVEGSHLLLPIEEDDRGARRAGQRDRGAAQHRGSGRALPLRREVAAGLAALGNRVVPRELDPVTAAAELGEVESEVVVVVAGTDRSLALRLIGAVRHEGRLPVVAAIEAVMRSSRRGGGGRRIRRADRVRTRESAGLRACRLRALRGVTLEQAFERRAVIEQAKGVLMASQGIRRDEAFALLREHSRRTNRKLVEIADAILKAHALFGRQATAPASEALLVPAPTVLNSPVQAVRSSKKQRLVAGPKPGVINRVR